MGEKITKQEALEALKYVNNLMGCISGEESARVIRQYIEDQYVETRYEVLLKAGIPWEELALVRGNGGLDSETTGSAARDLIDSFTWKNTKQGREYWDEWHEQLLEKEEGNDETVETRYDALVRAGIRKGELALVNNHSRLGLETSGSAACDLLNSFTWQDTEQGHDYWEKWRSQLNKREECRE